MPRIEKGRDLLAGLFPNVFPIRVLSRFYPQLYAQIKGFSLSTVPSRGRTTERASTGQQAYDFWIYPVLSLTPDINGSFNIEWKFINTSDWGMYDSEVDKGLIMNRWDNLIAGQQVQRRILDNTPSGQERGQAIGIGDVDFEAAGAQDGYWHSFTIDVMGTVTSPSGRQANFEGTWGPEDFRSWSELSTSLGFSVDTA